MDFNEAEKTTKANQKMHDIQANYYDAANLIMLEEGADSQVRIANTVKYIAAKTTGEYLVDVGCGTGNILNFSETCFKKSLGVDVSFEMLSRNKGRKAKLIQADINCLPLKSSFADSVSCFSVVHHLYESDFLINESYRILKPNGYFYSDNDPNKFSTELHDLNKQSAIFRMLMGIYFIPLRFSKSFRERARLLNEFNQMLKARGDCNDFEKLSHHAEYHLQSGLNPYEIKKRLEKAGFVDVRLYFHFRGKELREKLDLSETLSLLIRMILKPKFRFDYESRYLSLYELAPYFAILARKPA